MKKSFSFYILPVREKIDLIDGRTYKYFKIYDSNFNLLRTYDVLSIDTNCKLDIELHNGKNYIRIFGNFEELSYDNIRVRICKWM